MNTEITGIVLMYALVVLLAIPLGRYIGKIFTKEKPGWMGFLTQSTNFFTKFPA